MLTALLGLKKNPDSRIVIIYADGDSSQGYGQTKEGFKALTKDDNLQPYISDHDLR